MKKQAVLEAAKQWYRDYKVADSYEKFSTFVENLKRDENSSLLESIQTGIKTITENSGYSKDALSHRLGVLAEAALSEAEEDDDLLLSQLSEDETKEELQRDKEELERENEQLVRGEDDAQTTARELGEDKNLQERIKGKEDAQAGFDAKTAEIEKKNVSQESKFIQHLEPSMRKRANRYQGSVGEDVYGDLVIFALEQYRKIKEKKPDATGLDIARMVAAGYKMITRPSGKLMKLYDLDKYGTRAANSSRNIQRNKAWRKGVKPQYPHAVLHQGTAYQLKPEVVEELKVNDPRLQKQPNTPEGQDIWEQISREAYKALTNPIAGAASMDKTMGADSGTIGDTIESDDLNADANMSRDEANQKQAKLTLADVVQKLDSINEWASQMKGYTPLSDTEMKELKLRFSKPEITGEEIVAKIPELELIQKGKPTGRPKPSTFERTKQKLSKIISHEDWSDLREDIKLLSELQTDEIKFDSGDISAAI